MLISALASWKRQLAARIQNGNARRRKKTSARTSAASLETLEHRTLLSAVVGTGWERIGPLGSLVFQEDVTGGFGSGDIALFSDGFEAGVLGPEWTTASSTPQGRVQVSNSLGTPARSGSFHLAMDRNPAGTPNLNEAILTLDLAGQSGVSLSFWQKDVGDEETFLPPSFTGSRPGDGVSISADGVTWHTVVNFTFSNSPNNVYSRFTVDLDAAAAAAGIALGDDFQIKFQQYDDFPFNTDGRTFDDILITAEAPPVDVTEAFLEAGQTLTVVAAPDNPASALTVDVYGPGDLLLGSVTADGAGETVSLQTLEIGAEGTYRIAVSGDIGGTYDLSLFRNAAVEVVDSGSGAEQEITGSFIELGSGRYAVVGQFGNQQDEGEEEPAPVVWGIQRDTGLIVKIDPTTGAILDSFAAPGGVSPNHLFAGLTIAEGGNSLLYINGHTGPTTLYRLDPQTGAVLSTELMPPAVNPTFRAGLSAEDAVLEFSPESGHATTTLIFGVDDGIGIDVQFGFGGPMTKQFVAGPTQFPGALGGDDNGRAFAVFEPNVISEYSITTPNQILNTFAAPTADDAAAGLAFDGVHLYVADLSGNLFTLDPDTGAVLNRVTVAGGELIGLGAFREPVASEQALEDFEDGSLSEYTTVGSTAMRVEAIAAHDGQLGLVASNAPGWVYRDDTAAHVQQGDVFSVWVQTTGLSSSGGGRAYFGFGASGQGTYSVVMAPNSGQFLIQENVNFGFATLAAASQSWEAGKWYRIEVAWEQDGDIRARLYDSDGTTLLNSLAANDTTFTGGGIAFRAFGDTKYFDSVEKVGGTAAGKDTVHPAAAMPGEPLDDGEAASDPEADDPTAPLYVDPGNLPELVDSPPDSDVGASPSAAGTEVIVNGGFESGDFAGWTLNNLGSGSWVVNNGSHDPPGPGTPLPPLSGNFDALTSQGGGGTHTLSQAVTIPDGIISATLSWSDRIRNHAGTFADPGQEFRVVVRDTSGGLIQEIFSTDPGDPAQQTGPNNRSFDVTSLLQSLAGQTVRISFEEQDSLFYFNVTLDNVSLMIDRDEQIAVDTDEYLLDLSGKAGTSIDIVFDRDDAGSGETADESTLELIAPDGTTVLATGVASGENFDLGVLDFVVPAGGVYTVRVTGSDAQYSIVVAESLIFDTATAESRTTIFSDGFESGSLGSHWSVATASVPPIGNLQAVDAMIAGTLPSTTVVGTFAQADFSDQAGPSNGRWAFNNAIPGNGGDDYAVVTTGTLQVNQSGWYSFAIGSDDGGRLRIDGFDVIVDNANHAFADRYGSRFLTAGTHTFEWVGMERHGGAGFEMSVALGFNRSAVAAANGWRVIGAPDAHAQIALSGVLSTTAYYPDPLPVSEGRVEVTSGRGTPTHGGLFHLAMDDRVANTIYSRNEAVLTVDLTDQTEVELSLWHKDIGDEELNSLGGADMPLSFVGSVIGDGVSISADGVTWHTVLDFNDSPDPNSVYTRHIIDLSAAAKAAGIALGPNFRIKFQQYDDDPISIDGRTFDDIEITAAVPPEVRSIDGTGGALGFLGSGTGEVDLGLKQSFTAIPYTGWIPPDPIIAAGPEQLVGMVNGRVAIYDKDTGVTLFQQNLEGAGGFFGTVGATGSVFDPWVVFDPHSQRFFAIAVGVTNPLGTADDQCHVYLAVSTDSTPTSGNDWYKYRLDRTVDHRNLVNKTFADYLKLGVNEEGIFISANDFGIGGGGFSHVSLFAIEKQPLLSGGPVNIVYDENIFGAFSVHPLVVYDPGAPMYFAQSSTGSGNSIIVHTITDLLGTPTRTTSTVAVPSYAFPNDVPQQGGGAALDTMDARIMSGVVRDGSLWTAHSIRDPAVDAETVVRWYQFDVNGSPSLAQSGNVDPGPGLHTWMSHINVDADGDMGIAFSVAGPNQFASIGYTGRLASDPLGTTRPVEVARVGEGNYVRLDGIGRNRWGDYSGLAIDPDGETFWLFNEYATANNTWQTFVGAFEIELDAADVDFYTVTLASGDTVGFRTSTPFDSPLSGLNLLDPRIEIYDASGNLVASDSNGAADGRNAELNYRPVAGGVYTIVVATDEGSGDGEYVLSQFNVNDAPENVELVLSATEIDEDGMVTLTGTFADPDPGDTHTVVITWGDGESETVPLNGERSFVLTHRYRDDDPTGTSSDVYTIGAVVTDAEGASDTAAAAVTVRNVAPEVSGLSLEEAVIDENGTVTLTGTFADPGTLDTHRIVIAWGDGTNATVIDLTGGERTFSATHQYLDDDPTGTPSDVFTISVTVVDDDTGTDGESLSVRVNNLAPVITSIGNSAPLIGDAAEGVPVSVSAAFTDVGTRDTHLATIDWGDGTTSSAVITQGEGFGSLAGSHAYQQGGVYTIVVTLSDDDTGEAVAATTAFVSGVGVHDGALQIVGTSGDDLVIVNAVDGDWFRVHASFLPDLGGWRDVASAGVELIQVFLGAGDDLFVLAGDIRTPLVVDAGAGNDHVQGGGGRSILIGGEGSDHLIGGSGEDILIAGTTAFDGEADALRALLIEWASSRSLEERVANLYDGTGTSDRENGDRFLTVGPDGTVDDDGAEDTLTGGADTDWFFFDPELDGASMLRNELFANDLDSVLS